MNNISIIGILIAFAAPAVILILGKVLSKDNDDPGIQKVGKGLMNLGKFTLFIVILAGIFRLIHYLNPLLIRVKDH